MQGKTSRISLEPSPLQISKLKKRKTSEVEGGPVKKLKNRTVYANIPNDSLISTPESARKKKRPWRDKVRKKAAKLAAQKAKMRDPVISPEGICSNLSKKNAEKRKLKRKAWKKKMRLLRRRETTNENTESEQKLKSARFRFINEQLYTMSGDNAVKLFEKDPEAFKVYHEGYERQMKKWPYNPVNGIVQWLKSLDLTGATIVDMGCGDAHIAKVLDGLATVHSFDLVALNDRVTACNMSKVPLEKKTVDIVVFCLSLMGTNLSDYLREANRILKKGGILKIAEVSSRFLSVRQFVTALSRMGFNLTEKKRVGDGYFLMLDFLKIGKVQQKHPSGLILKPCLYKKR